DEPALCHGFLGREGGCSRGPYVSLNLSYWVDDNSRSVDVNWQRARRYVVGGSSTLVGGGTGLRTLLEGDLRLRRMGLRDRILPNTNPRID
ncbi:MAG: laccase domain-containing protein, partial [Candidatus Binataceae bacterium]